MHTTRDHFKSLGFTLIELMIALVIGTILVMLAAPSFNKAVSSNRVTTQANKLVSSINMARSEAVKRGSNVTICASTDQATCAGSNWATGWIVRLDSNNSVLQSQEAFKGNTAIVYNPAVITTVQYNSLGQATLAPSYTMTAEGCVTGYLGIRIVTISTTGRAAVDATIVCP